MLGNFEKYKSQTSLKSSTMIKLFIAYVINLGVIVLVVNANLQ